MSTEGGGSGASLVKEIICPQLGIAILCGALFGYSVMNPMKLPIANSYVTPSVNSDEPGVDPALDSLKLFDDMKRKEPYATFKKGDVGKAEEMALKLYKDDSINEDVLALMAAGEVLVASESPINRRKGLRMMASAIDAVPKSRYVRLAYARELFKTGRIQDSIEQYNDILKLSKDDWKEPQLELADIYIKNEQGSQAARLLRKLVKDDESGRLTKRLGVALGVAGDEDEGFKTFMAGSRKEYDQMNYVPEVQKDIEDNAGLPEYAIAEVRKRVEADPDNVGLRIELARLLMIASRYSEAKKHLMEARKKRESDPEIHLVLAEVLARMGDSHEASAEFAIACRLEPLNKPAAPPDLPEDDEE